MGVAAPGDLIHDATRTPFNIGRSIRLGDFSESEAQAWAKGVRELASDTRAFIAAGEAVRQRDAELHRRAQRRRSWTRGAQAALGCWSKTTSPRPRGR